MISSYFDIRIKQVVKTMQLRQLTFSKSGLLSWNNIMSIGKKNNTPLQKDVLTWRERYCSTSTYRYNIIAHEY